MRRPHGDGFQGSGMGFTLQGFGPFLHWLTLGVLAMAPVLVAIVIFKLGSLPGSIARARAHPQAEAIAVCGWMGIVTIVLWPVAMVWAHLVPGQPVGGVAPSAAGADASVLARLQQASRRLSVIEARLPKPASGGA
jgi:hypothetical protein